MSTFVTHSIHIYVDTGNKYRYCKFKKCKMCKRLLIYCNAFCNAYTMIRYRVLTHSQDCLYEIIDEKIIKYLCNIFSLHKCNIFSDFK